jgi:glycosyltransferase involved in cell wall biosynthesis
MSNESLDFYDKKVSVPILSICIPTYNRADFLEKTITSIVNQNRFKDSNDIEVIICDNCSNDNTQLISNKFVESFKGKIKYYRNEVNLYDSNFERALSYGSGHFLKLNNDTLLHNEGSLDAMIEVITDNYLKNNIIFFLNKNLNLKDCLDCQNLDEFIENISFWSGWIGAFGIWKTHFMEITDFNRYSHLKLPQLDVLIRLINSGKGVHICNKKLFSSEVPKMKGGYDLLEIFLDNYFFILLEQVNSQKLSKVIFQLEKKKILLQFIRPWLIEIKMNSSNYLFTYKSQFSKIYGHYRGNLFIFFEFLLKYYLSLFFNILKIKL